MRHISWEDVKGYATYENAMKKLRAEVPENSLITTMIAMNSKGRYIPVALGGEALRAGLHFRGICVAGG